jgi:hypothetical protein
MTRGWEGKNSSARLSPTPLANSHAKFKAGPSIDFGKACLSGTFGIS